MNLRASGTVAPTNPFERYVDMSSTHCLFGEEEGGLFKEEGGLFKEQAKARRSKVKAALANGQILQDRDPPTPTNTSQRI